MMTEVVLKAINICKKFGEMEALKGVTFELHDNEIIGLVGDNGAGKTTLIYVLNCVHKMDRGKVEFWNGEKITPERVPSSLKLMKMVGTVHQTLALAGERPIFENVFAGMELKKKYLRGLIRIADKQGMKEETKKLLMEFKFDLPPEKRVKFLSGGEQQILSIARVLYCNPRIIFLDEPTSNLSDMAAEETRKTIRGLKSDHSMIVIGHNLERILEISDRIIMLKLGRKVADAPADEISRKMILDSMAKK